MLVAALVVLGGAIGSLARYLVTDGRSAWWVLGVNVSGALLLALLVVRAAPASRLRPLLGTGVLGGWTTWSAAALITAGDLRGGDAMFAAGYLLATVAAGPLIVALLLRARRAEPA